MQPSNLVLLGLWAFFFFQAFYVKVGSYARDLSRTACLRMSMFRVPPCRHIMAQSVNAFHCRVTEPSLSSLQMSATESKPFDPYGILEIQPGASDRDVKRAYRKLSLLFHPDKNPDPAAAKYFAESITKAYKALSDPVARKNYEQHGHPDGPQVGAASLPALPHVPPSRQPCHQCFAFSADLR